MNDKKSNIRKILPAVVLILLVLFAVAGSDWFWNALSPITYKSLLYRNAGIYKVDPLLVAAIIKCESTFNPMAVSSAGAVGLMQLMPETAEELALEKKIDYVNSEELYKPEINIEIGFYYIQKLRKRYKGNLVLSLAAYNAGLRKGDEWASGGAGKDENEELNRITYRETRQFVSDVLTTYSQFKMARKIKRLLQFK